MPESPYAWPAGLYRRAQEAEAAGPPTPTARRVLGLLPPGGSLLDVGAGTGRASLPLAALGHPVTAVERNPAMALACGPGRPPPGVTVRVVEGSWPEAAAAAGRHDVALCAHVVYDVPDLVPFLRALHAAALVGVVLEAGDRHPWANLIPYYRALHGLERPDGPTADLLAEVVAEAVGVEPEAERWIVPARMRFADLPELVEFYRPPAAGPRGPGGGSRRPARPRRGGAGRVVQPGRRAGDGDPLVAGLGRAPWPRGGSSDCDRVWWRVFSVVVDVGVGSRCVIWSGAHGSGAANHGREAGRCGTLFP